MTGKPELIVYGICRSIGVPSMWWEDVYAEAFNTSILEGEQHPPQYYARFIAIHYAQNFGRFARGHFDRGEHLTLNDDISFRSLDEACSRIAPDPYAIADQVMDFREAIVRLAPTQRLSVEMTARGDKLTRRQATQDVYRARRKLRELDGRNPKAEAPDQVERYGQIIDLLDRGLSLKAIGESLGVSRPTIWRAQHYMSWKREQS